MSFMSETPGRELQPGESLGPYKLDELLGEGGMGLVFKATRESDGAVVALKVMRFELIEDPVFGRRFEQEARAAAEVTEPHLVPVLEAGQADGRRFLASKYIDGRTLDEMLDEGPLDLADTATYTQHVGAGLQALHEAGIVHRDLKPSNIIIDSTGTAMLTDFGLAKGRAYTVLTKPGQVMGTLDYLAPELVKGEPATPATDIYALGCTVYECIAGQPPFGDKEGIQVGLAHVAEPPPALSEFRDDLAPEFEAAVLSALAKDPESRPQTAVEYGDRLAQTAR
jgi:serine/threonine-protein kinase